MTVQYELIKFAQTKILYLNLQVSLHYKSSKVVTFTLKCTCLPAAHPQNLLASVPHTPHFGMNRCRGHWTST